MSLPNARRHLLTHLAPSIRPLYARTRPFHSTRRLANSSNTDDHSAFDRLAELQSTSIPNETADSSTLPWYLRVNEEAPARTTPEHILERQKLPDIPIDAPPILESLLQYISTELGMDYLTLIDLRKLDPPPALGSNLIMVIGTARSEKHLHVSADRLCRHLRSAHKLRPDADGLLGRNELKIRVRRRMKKLKQLADRGMNDQVAEVDDGMRTGWICVHVGGIEPAPTAEVEVDVDRSVPDGFVGFNDDVGSITFSAHFFTEEKRADVKLEELWTTVLDKSERSRDFTPDHKGAASHFDAEPANSNQAQANTIG